MGALGNLSRKLQGLHVQRKGLRAQSPVHGWVFVYGLSTGAVEKLLFTLGQALPSTLEFVTVT